MCVSNYDLGSGDGRQSGMPPERALSSALERTAVTPLCFWDMETAAPGSSKPLCVALLNLLVGWDDDLALERRLMVWGSSRGSFRLSRPCSLISYIITVSSQWRGGKIGIGFSLVTGFLNSCFIPSLISVVLKVI